MNRVSWSRPEPFGAWVRLGDSLLLAVDHDLAARLGVRGGSTLQAVSGPLEVHMAVTSRCYAPCRGCYLDVHPEGVHVPFEELVRRLQSARESGASTVAFGGGEPLLRDDLAAVADAARTLGLVPVLTTSGAGLTRERARGLRSFAQINVSFDGTDGGYEAVRGYDGGRSAVRAIEDLVSEQIPVGINFVVTRASFDSLLKTAQFAADLGVGEIQLLRYKPAGRAASPDYETHRPTRDQVEALWPTIASIAAHKRLRVRIDCAMVPLLSSALVDVGVHALTSLGVFGCEAGRHLGAVQANGVSAACSFLKDQRPEALSAYHSAPPSPCNGCTLWSVCRGGCQVVSLHRHGVFTPDPECPRVIEHGSAHTSRRHLPIAV
ncbi:MAG: radical SAM protein [Polyangiaceae bacterium]|nr:radical SAM protein [Polyangiaceae bacterium]